MRALTKRFKPFKNLKVLKPEPVYKNYATFLGGDHTALVKVSPQSDVASEQKQLELQAPASASESQMVAKRVSASHPTIQPSTSLAIYKPCKGLYALAYEHFDATIKTATKLYTLEFTRLHKLAIKHYATLLTVSDNYVTVVKSALQSTSQSTVSELYQTYKVATFKTCNDLYVPIYKGVYAAFKSFKHLYALESERLFKLAKEHYATFLGDDHVTDVKPKEKTTHSSDPQTEEEPTTSFSTI
jgi:hypothetical protein